VKVMLKRLPTPAMIVACVALFVALGGASYAAGVLPRNSVGTAQLKKKAVSAAKLQKNAVTSTRVKNDALTGADIRESSLGRVPSAGDAANAAHAASADSATTARNAANAANAAKAAEADNAAALNGRAANQLVRTAAGTQGSPLQTAPNSTAYVTAAEATITVPGPGYVIANGAINLSLISGGPGLVRARLADSAGAAAPDQESNDPTADLSPTYVFKVDAAATKTYRLQFRSGGSPIWGGFNGVITAIYVPFGGSGNTP
jgi:hypothetical protein